MLVPQHLRDQGLHQVVASIVTASGEPWLQIDGYQLLLYPFVTGTTAGVAGLTDGQWREYGIFMHELHGVVVTAALMALVPEESFTCPEAAQARSLAEYVRRGGLRDPVQHELAAVWLDHDAEIATLADRVDRLGGVVRSLPLSHVLCRLFSAKRGDRAATRLPA